MPKPHAEKGLRKALVGAHRAKKVFTQRCSVGVVREMTPQLDAERAILIAAEQEQNKVGRDLQAGLCQELAGIALLTKALHQQAKTCESSLTRPAADILSLIQNALSNARHLAQRLHPVDPLPGGLAVALRRMIADVRNQHTIRFRLNIYGQLAVSDAEKAIILYRIAKGCLDNVIRLIHVSHITMHVSVGNNALRLTVSGKLASSSAQSQPPAVIAIDETVCHRVRLLHGRIARDVAIGRSVSITCSIPLSEATNEDHQ